jgi:hypothetical protein
VQTDPERDLGELLLDGAALELAAGDQHPERKRSLVQTVVLTVLGRSELDELTPQSCQAIARVASGPQ